MSMTVQSGSGSIQVSKDGWYAVRVFYEAPFRLSIQNDNTYSQLLSFRIQADAEINGGLVAYLTDDSSDSKTSCEVRPFVHADQYVHVIGLQSNDKWTISGPLL